MLGRVGLFRNPTRSHQLHQRMWVECRVLSSCRVCHIVSSVMHVVLSLRCVGVAAARLTCICVLPVARLGRLLFLVLVGHTGRRRYSLSKGTAVGALCTGGARLPACHKGCRVCACVVAFGEGKDNGSMRA